MDYDPRRRRNNVPSALLISLFAQIFSQLQQSPYKPPVTIALLVMNIIVHIHPDPYIFDYSLANIRQNCIHPRAIVASVINGYLPLNRLVLAGFMHADDVHLYYNMLSLCWKGIQLESSMGSAEFLRLVGFSLFCSHSLMVLGSFILFIAGVGDSLSGFNTCAIGFSAVLFSLKYVLNHRSPTLTPIMGFMVPAKYAAWVELVLISIITPNASFLGHLTGIIAGYLYVKLPRVIPTTARPRYTYTSSPLHGHTSSYNSSYSTQSNTANPSYFETMPPCDDIELEELEELDGHDMSTPFFSSPASAEELRRKRAERYGNNPSWRRK